MDILLIGSWWGNQESASSVCWFWLFWCLHACGQHAVNFFYLVRVSVPAKQLKRHGSEYYLSPWEGANGPWFCLMAKLLILLVLSCFLHFLFVIFFSFFCHAFCMSSFLHFLTCLTKFILLTKVSLQTKGWQRMWQEGYLFWEGPIVSLSHKPSWTLYTHT